MKILQLDKKLLSDYEFNYLKTFPNVMEIKYLDPNFPTISTEDNGDWIDIKSYEEKEIKKGEHAHINLGFCAKIPNGYEAYIVSRSSTHDKYGLMQSDSMGVIDNAYCGDNDIWFWTCYGTRDVIVEKGKRVCQFRLFPNMKEMFFGNTNDFRKYSYIYNFNNYGEIKLHEYGLCLLIVDKLDNDNRGGFGSTGED